MSTEPVLVLVGPTSRVERSMIEDWARTADRPDGREMELVSSENGELSERLASADDELVTPVRVAWLPRERDGERRVRWRDLLTLTDPRHPPELVQARIAAREPDRARVVVGEPATVAELRTRWSMERSGAPRPSGTFAEFVNRQAAIALERAERALTGDRYKVPRMIAEQIQSSPRFRRQVGELAQRLGLPEDEVAARAAADLHGMVATQSRLAIDLFRGALRPMYAKAWEIKADTEGLEALRELNRKHALIFLPSHRSYADPLVLADVLAEHNFPRNHVLGGDNLAFWPVAPLAKRAGVVFIRRSFGDDEIYKMVVREYFAHLLAKRFNLEWYMEGGRSRTGKLRPPRYGLLHYVADVIDAGLAEDAYLVPVSITYDQLREVAAMAAEQRGGKKNREGLRWMARYARAQRTRVGAVRVCFGTPVSLRAQLKATADSPDGQRLAVRKAAFEVAVQINRVTPVLATALVTLALLGVRDRALTAGQLRRVLAPLLDYTERRGLPTGDQELLHTDAGVRSVLAELASEKVITAYIGGDEPVYAIERGQHLVAAFYRNSAIHHFVNRAIMELVLLYVNDGHTLSEGWAEALALRDLLKYEFFFPDKRAFYDELADELSLIDPDWAQRSGTQSDVSAILARTGFLLAHRVLRSFVDSELVVFERLVVHDPAVRVDEKTFLDECAGAGQQMLLQGGLHGPESLSRELFASAFKLAANQDLVGPGGDELRARREERAAWVRDVAARIAMIDQIDAMNRQETTGVQP